MPRRFARWSHVVRAAVVAAVAPAACGDTQGGAPVDDLTGTDVVVNHDVEDAPGDVAIRDDRDARGPGEDAASDAERDVAVDVRDVGGGETDADAGRDTPPDAADVGDASDVTWAASLFAPWADSVEMVASFAGWAVPGLPMQRGDDGWWRRDVPAGDGAAWRYVVRRMGSERWLADPGALELAEPYDDGVLRVDASPAAVAVALPDFVLYEAHAGTFRSPDAPFTGGFAGLAAGVGWWSELGVTAVALMPVHEFESERSWGYNPAWPFAVERSYGGFAGLRAFTGAAHARGVAVVGDFVLNHLDGGSPLCRVDTEPDEGCGGGWIAPAELRATPWGPRPAFAPASLRTWWADALARYVTVLGFDGLRFDATVWVRTADGTASTPWPDGEAMLRDATTALRAARPDGVWIAEDLQGDSALTRPVTEGGFGFDLQWDARWHGVVREVLLTAPSARDVDRLFDVVDDDPSRIIYLETHDTTGRLNSFLRAPHNLRLPDDLAVDLDADEASRALALGTVWLFTSPGAPMLLQGQEWWQGGWFHDDAPIDAGLAEPRADVVAWHRDLIAARRGACAGCGGLTTSDVRRTHRHPEVGVVAWVRGEEAPVLVVSNLGATDFAEYRVGAPAPGTWRVVAHSLEPLGGTLGVDAVTAEPIPWDADPQSVVIPLPAGSAVVLARGD